MSHLGLWLSALVDGELDGMERDRVLNHVAGCDACRREANAMRALKRRLTALGEQCAESAITGRLIELGRKDHGSVGAGLYGWAPWGAAGAGEMVRRRARVSRSGLKVAAGSAGTALIAIAVISFLLGSGSAGPPVPNITPSVDSYLLQHSRDAGQEPAGVRPAQGGAPDRAGHQRVKARSLSPVSPGGSGSPVRLDATHGPALTVPNPGRTGAGGSGPVAPATVSNTAAHSDRSPGPAGANRAGHTSK